MDYVNQSHQVVIITKRNIPLARLTPILDEDKDVFGCMKKTVTIQEDILAPVDISWNAML